MLAAGESTRMGRLKQLLPWNGAALVAWQASELREAGADDVIVVLGHEAEQVRPEVPGWARVVINEAYQQGRATSLQRGAEAVADDVEAVLILSVDQPRPAWLARALLEHWRSTNAPVVSPRFASGYGHPIVVDGSVLGELRLVSDETLGLRALIDRHAAGAESITVSNEAVDVDLNTPSDYEAALASYQDGEWERQG